MASTVGSLFGSAKSLPAPQVYLVGGGIASMAAAASMIRDGDAFGQNITILEESSEIGGSLDGAGSPEEGYVLRGGRMLESKGLCAFGLFALIPTPDESETVTQETLRWNKAMKTASKSWPFRNGQRQTAPKFGLREKHILTIERLMLEPEDLLSRTSIAEQFDAAFFQTDFWMMWSATFAFQHWHSAVEFKRYPARFVHIVDGFGRLHGVMGTVYNQHDSLVRPLHKWLDERGVPFEFHTRVTDLGFTSHDGKSSVACITACPAGIVDDITVTPRDYVLVTLGSMTEASSFGNMHEAPALRTKHDAGAWTLWQTIAAGRSEFGCPSVFADHVDQSKWVSFTTTLHEPTLLRLVRDLTGNVPGEDGLSTFPDSAWLASIVIPHQLRSIGQPEGVAAMWGYGLFVERAGNLVKKPMSECSGREIMAEVLGHLRITAEAAGILETCICIPCMMPFITSQFLPRKTGDRPAVLPEGTHNLAFIGQFREVPEDVVFAVAHSVRSEQLGDYGLLNLQLKPPAVYKGKFDSRVLLKAICALHELAA